MLLKPGKHNPLLFLIFALAAGIADLARLIGAEEQNLAQPQRKSASSGNKKGFQTPFSGLFLRK